MKLESNRLLNLHKRLLNFFKIIYDRNPITIKSISTLTFLFTIIKKARWKGT